MDILRARKVMDKYEKKIEYLEDRTARQQARIDELVEALNLLITASTKVKLTALQSDAAIQIAQDTIVKSL